MVEPSKDRAGRDQSDSENERDELRVGGDEKIAPENSRRQPKDHYPYHRQRANARRHQRSAHCFHATSYFVATFAAAFGFSAFVRETFPLTPLIQMCGPPVPMR